MDFLQTVETDAEDALTAVKNGLTYLKTEGEAIIAWVEKEVPASAGAIATFLQGAETDAAELAKIAASGLSTEITAGSDAMETFLLNLIQSTGLAANAQAGLKSIDASGVSLIQTIGQGLVSTGLASILAKLAPTAAAVVAAV